MLRMEELPFSGFFGKFHWSAAKGAHGDLSPRGQTVRMLA
jgi:hypothetical protein